MKRVLLTLLVLFTSLSLLPAQVAELDSYKAPFQVIRDISPLKVSKAQFLFEDLDVIFSGGDPLSLKLIPFTGIEANLTLAPHSVLLLSLSSLKEEQTAQVFLLKGKVEAQVNSLVGSSQLALRVGNLTAQIPVKGQVSAVSLTPRDTLMIPLQGQLRVSQTQGGSVVVARGVVVEMLDNKLSTRPVSGITLSGYADAWLGINRPREMDRPERLMRLILTQQAMFARAMGRLRSAGSPVWAKWASEEASSMIGTPADVAEEKNTVQGALISTYPYTIPLLEGLFALEDVPSLPAEKQDIKLSSEWTAGQFARQFASFSSRVQQDVWQYLYWLKLYKKRNNGDFFEV